MTESLANREFDIPSNKHNLRKGSVLKVKTDQDMSWAGLKQGDEFATDFDGKTVRAGGLSWSVKQLCKEIDDGIWEIMPVTDFDIPSNKHNLQNGSILKAQNDNILSLAGLKKGNEIQIYFDGRDVRARLFKGEDVKVELFKWDVVEDLCSEIDHGWWEVVPIIDVEFHEVDKKVQLKDQIRKQLEQ